MLDVHPPHTPTHTWKDFFIHIATIVIGLLIAIGLEQTVEAVEHHRQREELITDFRGECRRNIQIVDRNLNAFQQERDWQRSWLSALLVSAQDPGMVRVSLPARPSAIQLQGASGAVWTLARSNGKAALLPENLGEIYDRVARENDQAYHNVDLHAAAQLQISDLARADGFAVNILQATGPATVTLSFAQRSGLIAALAHSIGTTAECVRWFAFLKGASNAVLDNVESRDAMMPYLQQALPPSTFD